MLTESPALLLKTRLWLQILIGMITGIGLGLLISPRGKAVVSNHTAELIAGRVAAPDYVFLVQVYGIDLSVPALLLLIATTIGASIGGTRHDGRGHRYWSAFREGLACRCGIALLIGVDRILDMSSTLVDITGDITACLVLESCCETSAKLSITARELED